ncbi:MAG: hypothetical protein IJW40_00220 [Clostridia bacterium]|nr:hypothetical protein [Clostridia bacterium]
MKHNLTRLSTLLLAMILALGMLSLVSCATPQGDENEDPVAPSGTDDPQEPDEPKVERLPLDLPTTTYGGEVIHFLAWSANGQTDIGSGWIPWEEIDVADYDGDPINKAVYDRNGAVEEAYDVQITSEYISVDQGYSTQLRNNHTSGDDAFQIITQRSYEIKTYVLEGLMYNMYELDNLHTDMPWWNQDSVRSFTLGSTLYFAAPEMLLRDKGATATMYYNAKVATDQGVDNLYDLVMAGEWTFEEFISISESVATSLDGDDIMNGPEDLWGAAVSDDAVYYLFAGANMKFAHIDEDGYIQYDYGSEESILYMQDIFDYAIYSDHCAHGSVVDLSASEDGIFKTDNALFNFGLVKGIIGLRNMDSDFGVLPIPKYDKYQDNYASLVWVHHDCVLGIPAVVANTDAVSAVLEHMSYLSYYDIYPVFYDTVIMGKSTRDEQSKEMLKIVFETRLFDPGQYWDNGEGASGIHGGQGYLHLAHYGDNNISSVFARFENILKTNFAEFNELIDELS